MKLAKTALVVSATAVTLAFSSFADARGWHGHGGGGWGWGGWGWGLGIGVAAAALTAPYWAYRPYYYPYAYAPAYGYGYAPYYPSYGPVTYVDRAQMDSRYQPQAAMPQQAPEYFFCRGSNSYYPYARTCAGGWERISARPVGM